MRGISSRVTRGLPTQARIQCVDNTGAKVVQLISVMNTGGVARRYPAGGVGDLVRVTVKNCLLYTSPSPRDPKTSRMPSSA